MGSEALISCPSRQPCSRQWFLWCFGVHFHPFRTFSLFFAFFPPKATFAPKSGFGRKSASFCAFRPFLESFLHPSANLALDNGFFGVLGSLFPFYPFLAPFCVFRAKMHFWGQKAFLGAKSGFGPKSCLQGLLGALPGWLGASQGGAAAAAGRGDRGEKGRTGADTRAGGGGVMGGAGRLHHPSPPPPPPPPPPPHAYGPHPGGV